MDELYPAAELDRFLPRADYVVVCCALHAQTRGILDARRLALMRPTAVLVNVARGECVEESALYEACRRRTIAGAALDVWYRYPSRDDPQPAPAEHPFHTLDNVLMTPHSAAWTTGMRARRVAQIAANLDALARGEPLANVVGFGTREKAAAREPEARGTPAEKGGFAWARS